jgi:3-hydroxyacyl-CoA dehydrogenase
MGSAIAAAHARRFHQVVLVDTSQAALERARGQILAELAAELPGREAERLVAHLVSRGSSEEPLAGCDLVLESIVEDLGAKRRLYARLEPRLSPRAILASNTSAIPIGRLAAGLADPGRFLGLHFCHPVRGRPLVEVVRGPGTSDRTVARGVTHAHRLGKMPMVVEDGPGFVINRLLLTYLGAALAMVSEGVPPGHVEQAMIEFGMGVGPLEMLDEIGLDTALQAGLVLSEIFGERLAGTHLLIGLIKAHQMGRKSGAGFYLYPGRSPNPGVARLVAKHRPLAPGPGGTGVSPVLTPDTGETPVPPIRSEGEPIALRLLLPMVWEARRILAEGKVGDPRDIDAGVIFGLGFPAARGGLLWWADTLGKGILGQSALQS